MIKNISILLFVMLLLLNLLSGLVFSSYEWSNIGISSAVLLINAFLFYWIGKSEISDAFKISFHFVLWILIVIEIVLAIIMPAQLKDNGYFIGIIVCIMIEVLMVAIASVISKIDQKDDRL